MIAKYEFTYDYEPEADGDLPYNCYRLSVSYRAHNGVVDDVELVDLEAVITYGKRWGVEVPLTGNPEYKAEILAYLRADKYLNDTLLGEQAVEDYRSIDAGEYAYSGEY
jgi:hypothetical protein